MGVMDTLEILVTEVFHMVPEERHVIQFWVQEWFLGESDPRTESSRLWKEFLGKERWDNTGREGMARETEVQRRERGEGVWQHLFFGFAGA